MATDRSYRTTRRRKFPSQAKVRSMIHRFRYRLSFLPSWSVAFGWFERAGKIGSIPIRLSFFRNLLLSYPLSPINRFGRFRGRPGEEAFLTETASSVFSTSEISDGVAASRYAPSGVPLPSASTIHFVPFPFRVLPTFGPLFLQEQSSRR